MSGPRERRTTLTEHSYKRPREGERTQKDALRTTHQGRRTDHDPKRQRKRDVAPRVPGTRRRKEAQPRKIPNIDGGAQVVATTAQKNDSNGEPWRGGEKMGGSLEGTDRAPKDGLGPGDA